MNFFFWLLLLIFCLFSNLPIVSLKSVTPPWYLAADVSAWVFKFFNFRFLFLKPGVPGITSVSEQLSSQPIIGQIGLLVGHSIYNSI